MLSKISCAVEYFSTMIRQTVSSRLLAAIFSRNHRTVTLKTIKSTDIIVNYSNYMRERERERERERKRERERGREREFRHGFR